MGIFRFAEELTTATYEFERMTWDEMDEIFWTEEDIGEFRNFAFMVDCELEEEDWSGPDVDPLPWNKEIDNKKIEKFESNLNDLKAKRKREMEEFAQPGKLPSADVKPVYYSLDDIENHPVHSPTVEGEPPAKKTKVEEEDKKEEISKPAEPEPEPVV